MILDLTGVLEDGADRGVLVPSNPRKALHIVQSSDVTIRFRALRAGGDPLDLTTGLLFLTIKKRSEDGQAIISRLGTLMLSDGQGRADFIIGASETKDIVPGYYVYDVWFLASSGDRDALVPLSSIQLEPAVARIGQTVTTTVPSVVPIMGLPPLTGLDYSGLVEHPSGTLSWLPSDIYFHAACLSSDAVGDLVYVSGPEIGGLMQVAKIDVTDLSKMPAVGFIIEKASATMCTVKIGGVVSPPSVTLTPGKRYFAGSTGQVSAAVPIPPISGVAFVQVVGVAKAADKLLLEPNFAITRRVA